MIESVEEFGNRWRFRALEAEAEVRRLRADRATVLREAASIIDLPAGCDCGGCTAVRSMADLLRRRADGVCNCVHPTDEHSVYGCADGCACEYLPKRKPAATQQPKQPKQV